MAIRDWFRSAPAPAPATPPAPAGRRFHGDRARMFDIAGTHQLAASFAVPRERRDADWSRRFWDAAWCGSVALAEPATFVGPDGFPYLRLDLPRPGTAFESQCLANLAGDCLSHRVGAAFFAGPDDPSEAAQYVLSFGLIDSLLRYDSPDGDPIDVEQARLPPEAAAYEIEQRSGHQRLVAKQERPVLVGTPSADYLPPHAAHALFLYLEQVWGLNEPRVQLIADTAMRPHRSLIIGRKRSEFPDPAAVDDLARMPVWYLTPGRMVMLMPEHWSLGEMTPLRDLFG